MPATKPDTGLRITALEMASRHGLPPSMTLNAARSYLAFIENNELVTSAAGAPVERVSVTLLNRRRRTGEPAGKPSAKAPAKKAARRR